MYCINTEKTICEVFKIRSKEFAEQGKKWLTARNR